MLRLVDSRWDRELRRALSRDRKTLRVACPFIKRDGAERLVARGCPDSLQVITRFNLDHFSEGVSDTSALRLLLENGAQIRGIKRLHAKLYLFGDRRAIVTSANLTKAGLTRNHELGFVSDSSEIVGECLSYFQRLWERAGDDLILPQVERWEERIAAYHSGGGPSSSPGLGDEGVDLGRETEIVFPPWSDEPSQGFVKFFGEGHRRAARTAQVFDEVDGAGCHWACTYPKGRRPRAPRDGAIMFIGQMVHSPDDTLVYGRAVGMRYVAGRDDASAEDVAARRWKAHWPHYIRVHHPEFIAGVLQDGVPLSELMDTLGPGAFGSTAENAAKGSGNTDPRLAIRQAPAVRLSAGGLEWMNERLELVFQDVGKIPPAQMAELDWPE
jgi:PLD-like domain